MSEDTAAKKGFSLGFLFRTEDWWTVWLGTLLLVLSSTGVIKTVPRLKGWTDNIASALPADLIPGLLALGAFLAVICGIAYGVVKRSSRNWAVFAWLPSCVPAGGAGLCNRQSGDIEAIRFQRRNLGIGFGVSDIKCIWQAKMAGAALQTELFIKTGLVVMGAELLFNRILVLGGYGLGVAWLGCPLVLFLMYQYGIRILKMKDKSLVATIAACTSVCGVSAAVATGAATKAKKRNQHGHFHLVNLYGSDDDFRTIIHQVAGLKRCGWRSLDRRYSGLHRCSGRRRQHGQ